MRRWITAMLLVTAAATAQTLDMRVASCANARSEGAPPVASLALVLAGRTAAANGPLRYAPAHVEAITAALNARCDDAASAAQRLADIAAAVPMPPPSEGDRHIATMTCMGLGQIWRSEARRLVPFLAGSHLDLVDRAAFDRIGEGLPRACRENGARERPVMEVLRGLG